MDGNFYGSIGWRNEVGTGSPLYHKKLHIDADYFSEVCARALIRIGTDTITRAIYQSFPTADWHFRLYASGPLEHIHTDLAADNCLKLAKKEKDLTIKTYLARALISQFSYEGIEFVYSMVKNGRWGLFYCDLKEDLLTACTIMEKKFPEHDKWAAEIIPKREERKRIMVNRKEELSSRTHFQEDVSQNTLRRKIGRNEPCPCGSGKKYKKCCGGR